MPARRHARQFQRHADRAGSAGAKQDLREIARRDLGQLAGQIDGHLVGVAAGAERHFVELRLHSFDHGRIGKADLVDVVAMEVHVTAPGKVLDPDPFAGLHAVQAGSRERLMQKIAGVVRQQTARGVVDVFQSPALAQGRDVDVPLRLLAGQVVTSAV